MSDALEKNLNNNETLILNSITIEGVTSQRELAKRCGLSIGLINLLIKNLIKKGYIELTQINKKNYHYYLTPKGIIEKLRWTNFYIKDTLIKLEKYKQSLIHLITGIINHNQTHFIILGKNELADITEMVLKSFNHVCYTKITDAKEISVSDLVILDCRSELNLDDLTYFNKKNYINITDYLAKKWDD